MSGVNVNVFTRCDHQHDRRQPAADGGPNTKTNAPRCSEESVDAADAKAGRDIIYGGGHYYRRPEADFDIIFGDHGAIVQNVADPNSPAAPKSQTRPPVGARPFRGTAKRRRRRDRGNLGRDIVIAGAGHDMADGDGVDDRCSATT
jgi:hypothetical protein